MLQTDKELQHSHTKVNWGSKETFRCWYCGKKVSTLYYQHYPKMRYCKPCMAQTQDFGIHPKLKNLTRYNTQEALLDLTALWGKKVAEKNIQDVEMEKLANFWENLI